MLAVKLLLGMNVLGYGVVLLGTLLLGRVSRENQAHILGWICMAFSLCVFAAPLCIMVSIYIYVYVYTYILSIFNVYIILYTHWSMLIT